MHKGKYDKAFADCNQALALDPKHADAYIILGLAWGEKGDYDKAIADLNRALAIKPDHWSALNDLGVFLWIKAQGQDIKAAKAEAAGDLEAAKAYRQKSVALKNDAMAQWNHGIMARPTATDIHSNLGYAYSEASERDKTKGDFAAAENDLDKAEWHLKQAVRLKPISPWPHNNLGRVLLRRSQECEAKAREAEAKGKTDPDEAEKVKPLRADAKVKLDAAIEQFTEAVELEPTLLEARLNLGEVFLSLNDLDKAEAQYRAIVNLRLESVRDLDVTNNFSQAYFGLARIAIARKKSDEAIDICSRRSS